MPRPPNPAVRGRLLNAGLALLHRDGFAGAGINDITAAAGIPKGSFYSYFPSKEQFAMEVLEHYWAPIERRLLPMLADESTAPADRLREFFHALAEDHEAQDFTLGCFIGRMSLELGGSSDAARARLTDIFGRWDNAIAACLGTSRPSPEALAADIVGAWEGAALRAKVSRSRQPYDRFEYVVLPALLAAR